ncbi:MAG: hypothetical protein U9R66_10235 [Thermodesulfobacteriota bacterium]|nr:hypothetical protein [Desulfobulbaceae bacterium]MEA3548028.1 hypothetical protein [Thermodesulfobacteriota bacterium]
MKKLIVAILVVTFSAGIALAGGGQNVGTKGQGDTKTGTTSQGAGTQDRTGR